MSQASHILQGLLDCVGEIKRLVYDRMRSGNEEDAEKLFAKMEEIYNAIYPFAVYDNIVSGLRRKLDVARMLIEDIRATVTEESRRKALIEAVDRFEKRYQRRKRKIKLWVFASAEQNASRFDFDYIYV